MEQVFPELEQFSNKNILRINPQLEEMGLLPEYLEATRNLVKRVEDKGIKDFFLVGMGSLTRTDKAIRKDPHRDGYILSDADFVCVPQTIYPVSKNSLQLLLKGESHMQRQLTDKPEKPFSEHIPYFQVELLTPSSALQKLQHAAEVFNTFEFNGSDREDYLEQRRSLNSVLTLYTHLQEGNVMQGIIPKEIVQACQKIRLIKEKVDTQYKHLR